NDRQNEAGERGFDVPMNPSASERTAACRGLSERKRNGLFSLRTEDAPQRAAESFKSVQPAG
ncbi:MAG: hypothetical protein KKF28_01595, partial [Proteobacteria bacterium]|nr:hypothetical protein [Pseudomonadota bacterium]